MLILLEILVVTELSLGALLFSIIITNFFKNRTELNQLLIVAYFGMGFGTLTEDIILQFLLLLNIKVILYDQMFFFMQIFFLGVGISAVLKMSIVFNESSGHKVKLGMALRIIYISIPIIFSILTVMSHYKTPVNEFGYSYYQMNPYLTSFMILSYIPLLIYLVIQQTAYLKQVKRELRLKSVFLAFFLAIIPVVRIVHLSYYPLLGNSPFIMILFHTVMIILLLPFAIMVLYDLKFLETLFSFFAVNALFIIKDSGQTIFGYNFKSLENKEYFSRQQLLLGGFLYAISKGLENTLYFHGKLKTIEIGDTSLLIRNGTHVFAVLFTSEVNQIIKEKLENFLTEFEITYQQELKDWTGAISNFDNTQFINLVLKYFR